MSALVEKVVAFAKKEFRGETLERVKASKTQFQDIIAAASQAASLEEFKLYIAYKAAKAKAVRNMNMKEALLWESLGGELNKFIELDLAPMGGTEKEKLAILHKAMGYLMWAAYAAAEGVIQHV